MTIIDGPRSARRRARLCTAARSPRLGSLFFFLFLLLVAPLSGLAQDDSRLDPLRAKWKAQEYETAFRGLVEYKTGPYGKTFEVYYMIGTSLCRMPPTRDLGLAYLDAILANFSPAEDERVTVENEKRLCKSAYVQAAVSRPVLISFNTTRVSAGVGGRTKMFYFVGGNNAVRSVPVEIVREVPRAELSSRLLTPEQRQLAETRVGERAGAGARTGTSKYFVLASSAGHSAKDLKKMGEELDLVYDFFVAKLGMRAPQYLITVYMVPSFEELQATSLRMHGIRVAPQSLGYSYRDDLSMVGVVPTSAIGTLRHELFHLMVRNDFGDIPPWMDEGMAALYEVAIVSPSGVRGVDNWRGQVLRELAKQAPSVPQLVTMDWRAFSGGDDEYGTMRQAAIHAKARYFLLYLQERDELQPVYHAFKKREIGTDSAALLKSVLGDLAPVEESFRQWFAKFK
jgi:hypothetical protein